MPSASDQTLQSFLTKFAAKKPKLLDGIPDFPTGWRVSTVPKRQEELHMWRTWKDQGEQPDHMEPLLKSLQPLINKRLRQFSGVEIRPGSMQSEANRKVIGGLRRFDPSRAQMHTFLTHELKGVSRFVQHHQNLSRIVEDRSNKVGKFQKARADLAEELGRDPTSHEIADRMKVSVVTVTRLQGELREDLLASGAMEDPFIEESPRHREVFKLLPYELDPSELLVYEYLAGYGGKPKITSTGDIAKRLGWSDSKVSQMRRSIGLKMKQYL